MEGLGKFTLTLEKINQETTLNQKSIQWTLGARNSNRIQTEDFLGKVGVDSSVNLLIISRFKNS